jgi:hypothetical protein
MTELCFPAGVVRIDESRVWRELAKWSAKTGGDVVLRNREGQFIAMLSDGAGKWQASSALSLDDAVANALKAAEPEEP